MDDRIDPTTLELNDTELLELIKHHRTGRRSVLAAMGLAGAATLGSGVAEANHTDPHPPNIDPYYGYSAPEDEALPQKLRPDHTIELRIGGEGGGEENGQDDNGEEEEGPPPFPFHFQPMGLHIDAGDIVRFDFPTPDHNVTPYHLGHGRQHRVPADLPPFSSPVINPGGFWLYEFNQPGTHDLYCAPHQIFGMVLRLVVGDPDSSDYDDEFSEEGRPPVSKEDLSNFPGVEEWVLPTSADAFGTDALSVDNIVDDGPIDRFDVGEELAEAED